jgi:hypothetical protein
MQNATKRREIIHCLEDLAQRMKNHLLTNDEERNVTEFYLQYLYRNKGIQSIENIEGDGNDEKELKKYLVMGWYVYSQLDS